MKKWKCQNESCGKNCELSIDYQPIQCPRGLVWVPKWQEMEELNKGFVEKALREAQKKITGKSTALPKLTAEVFDRQDCPEWAKWAAVDKYRNAMWYEGEPKVIGSVFWNSKKGQIMAIPGKWDATDWQNSLIERPAKLPEWCKVGEWVAYYGEKGHKYFKIAKIELNRLYSEDGKFSLMCDVAQARLRPYTPEEMKALVGKVIVENKSGDIGFVTGYCNRKESVYAGRNDFVAALLLSDYTIDGKPCGVLEHIENGEWVE